MKWLAVAALIVVWLTPSIANASQQNVVTEVPVASNWTPLEPYEIKGEDPSHLAQFDLDVQPVVIWRGKFHTGLGWETSNVRQGSSLSVTHNAPYSNGTLTVAWNVTGKASLLGGAYKFTVDEQGSDEVVCVPMTYGADYTCTAKSDPVTVARRFGAPAYAKVVLRAVFTVTPDRAILDRRWWVPDGSSAEKPVWLSLIGGQDTFTVPCTEKTGRPFYYELSDLLYSPWMSAYQRAYAQVGLTDPTGLTELPASFDGAFGPSHTTSPFRLSVRGGGVKRTLGTVLPNQTQPTIAPLEFTGKAGVPLQLHADVGGRCTITDWEWRFSDGTTSFGSSPQRSFSQPGVYDAKLTITDNTGLQASRTFKVTIG